MMLTTTPNTPSTRRKVMATVVIEERGMCGFGGLCVFNEVSIPFVGCHEEDDCLVGGLDKVR